MQPDAFCFHLNFQGEGQLQLTTAERVAIYPQSLVWSRGARTALRSPASDRHECLTLVYPDGWLSDYLREVIPQVPQALQPFFVPPLTPGFLQSRALTVEDHTWARTLAMTCTSEAARRLLDTARLSGFLLRELFSQEAPATPLLISRSERAARDRMERVKAQVCLNLDKDHDLESLAAAAGCSPHYLSRTFSQVEGVPLMLWIRHARVERAAELIASGRCNVSEAALEVGYNSFSHFSRAFYKEKGVSPSKWISHLAQKPQL